MVTPIILTANGNAAKVKEITAKLEAGVLQIFDTEKYKDYLKMASRFHSYSFNNTLLILMQGGETVAGYKTWQKLGRNVKKGAKGIKIFAPYTFKKKSDKDEDEEESTCVGFRVVSVFDVSQTEGKDIPEAPAQDLTDSVEGYQKFFNILKDVSPVPIEFKDISGSTHGYYTPSTGQIAIKTGMSESQTLKTTIHEIAHSLLHGPGNEDDSRTREVQAESVAYVVCNHYGLDTSEYSFGYIALWSSGKEVKELKASMEIIQKTAHNLIESIDSKLI